MIEDAFGALQESKTQENWQTFATLARPLLLNVASQVVKEHGTAEEVVQDVLLRLNGLDISQIRNIKPYLVVAAKNTAIKYLDRDQPTELTHAVPAFDSTRNVDAADMLAFLYSQLNADESKLLDDVMESKRTTEIAEELGIKPSAVAKRISRLRKRIGVILETQK